MDGDDDDDSPTSLSLLSLRRAGVQFDDNVTSLSDLFASSPSSPATLTRSNDFVKKSNENDDALARLCRAWFLRFKKRDRLLERLPKEFPPESNPSGRFRAATSYARALNAVLDDATKGTTPSSKRIGFSHFLYPSEQHAREIVSLLCEMIPEGEKNADVFEGTGSSASSSSKNGSSLSALERAVRVATNAAASSGGASSSSISDRRKRRMMREIVNAHARILACKQRMRDREGFSLTTNKDVAWTKENGLWPEGPDDDEGFAVNVLASKGAGGLVAAALKVAGGDKLALISSSRNNRSLGNVDQEESEAMRRLGDKIKSAAEARKNREDFANQTLEQRAEAREKDLEDLQNDVETTRVTMEAYVLRCEKALSEMLEYARLEKEERAKFPDLEEEYLIRKMATDMVVGLNAAKQSPEKAREEMEKLVQEDESRRQDLQKEWDDARLPLEREIEKRNAKAEAERTRAKEQLEEIQRWKEEAKEQIKLARQKAEERDQLLRALERAPKGVNRPSLVQKVTTIVKNIKKQDLEISKIVRDAKAAELQVAESAESLRKIYAVVEDAIFKAAKTDETMKMAYRYLHDMHKMFAKISRDVAEASESARARGELEKQMDSLKELNTDSSRVAKDVSVLRKSVKKLEERVNVKK